MASFFNLCLETRRKAEAKYATQVTRFDYAVVPQLGSADVRTRLLVVFVDDFLLVGNSFLIFELLLKLNKSEYFAGLSPSHH